MPEVNSLVFDVAETTISMRGWKSERREVLETFLVDAIFKDGVEVGRE